MSYDIWVEVDVGGAEPLMVGDWRYTSNCVPMWCAAGADLAEFDGRDAAGCAEGLEAALATLKAEPERFRQFNPPNGWGDYDSLVPALDELLGILVSAPRGIVKVWR